MENRRQNFRWWKNQLTGALWGWILLMEILMHETEYLVGLIQPMMALQIGSLLMAVVRGRDCDKLVCLDMYH